MYVRLPRPSAPGMPCLALRVTGSPSRADAEHFCRSLDHLPERQPVRLLLRFEAGSSRDGWAPLRAALRRRVRVVRVAFVGGGTDFEGGAHHRCYAVRDEAAAWAWVQGAVPPVPSWHAAAPKRAEPLPARLGTTVPEPVPAAYERTEAGGDGAVRLPTPPTVRLQEPPGTPARAADEPAPYGGWPGALSFTSSAVRRRIPEQALGLPTQLLADAEAAGRRARMP